jgi:hypothetical protein
VARTTPSPDPVLYCPTCYHTEFQESKPRPEDRVQMLLMKLPVRCKHCRERIYASRSFVKTLREETSKALA